MHLFHFAVRWLGAVFSNHRELTELLSRDRGGKERKMERYRSIAMAARYCNDGLRKSAKRGRRRVAQAGGPLVATAGPWLRSGRWRSATAVSPSCLAWYSVQGIKFVPCTMLICQPPSMLKSKSRISPYSRLTTASDFPMYFFSKDDDARTSYPLSTKIMSGHLHNSISL